MGSVFGASRLAGSPSSRPTLRAPIKAAAQDDTRTASPNRSATGESKGLTFASKPDHYMQGQDAWASVSGYMKGGDKKKPNPFQGKHALDKAAGLGSFVGRMFRGTPKPASTMRTFSPDVPTVAWKPSAPTAQPPITPASADGFSPGNHPETMAKIQRQWPMLHKFLTTGKYGLGGFGILGGAMAQPKLALDKQAAPWGQLLQRGKSFFGAGAAPAAKAPSPFVQQASRVAPGAPPPAALQAAHMDRNAQIAQQFAAPRYNSLMTSPAATSGPGNYLRQGWQATSPHVQGQVGQTALGGVLGGFGAEHTPFDTGSTWGNVALGAAAFNPKLRGLASKPGYGAVANVPMRSMQGGFVGAAGGEGLDALAMASGLDGTNFARMGGTIGTAAGGVSGAGKAMQKVAPGTRFAGWGRQTQQFGDAALNPITRPFKNVGNMLSGKANLAATAAAPMRYGRLAGLGATGILGTQNLLGGLKTTLTDHGLDVAEKYLNYKVPEIADYAQGRTMDALGQMGMLDANGQVSLGGLTGRGLSGAGDQIFRALGMDPTRMSPVQKMMVLGGGAVAGGGALAGSPVMAGLGGLGLLGGLVPGMMPNRNAQFPGLDNPPQPQGPTSRDEWQVQQRLGGMGV